MTGNGERGSNHTIVPPPVSQKWWNTVPPWKKEGNGVYRRFMHCVYVWIFPAIVLRCTFNCRSPPPMSTV